MVFRSPAAARLLLTVLLALAPSHALAQETYPRGRYVSSSRFRPEAAPIPSRA